MRQTVNEDLITITIREIPGITDFVNEIKTSIAKTFSKHGNATDMRDIIVQHLLVMALCIRFIIIRDISLT